MASPFDVLRLEEGADEAAVEAAYRERVKEAHPDQGGSIEEFQAVRAAYEALLTGEYETEREDETVESDVTTATGTRAAGNPERDPRPGVAAEVTFLNYDVLTDFGWTVEDDDLFRKAARTDLEATDYGHFEVEPGESLLEAAENRGFAWPFACRGGACVNCAIMLHEGELSMPVSHVLPAEFMERGIRLSCNGMPITDELKVVYNVKHMPELEELLLPPRPFEQAHSDD